MHKGLRIYFSSNPRCKAIGINQLGSLAAEFYESYVKKIYFEPTMYALSSCGHFWKNLKEMSVFILIDKEIEH